MRRVKRAFTTVELVITLALMGIFFALTAVTTSNITSIQKEMTSIALKNKELDSIDSLVKNYVSFLNLKTTKFSHEFNLSSSSENKLVFTTTFDNGDSTFSTYDFSLVFSNNELSVTSTYPTDGEVDYLKYHDSLTTKYTESITFVFNSDLSLIKSTITQSSSRVFTYVYNVRVN